MDRCIKYAVTGLLTLGSTAAALADETIKFRAIYHGVAVQSQEVGDVPGHALSVARNEGLASFPDGSVGTAFFVSSLDFTKGGGPALVYNNLTLPDGSVLWYKANATVISDGGGGAIKGAGVIVGGTGRFAGAKGEATYTGARMSAVGVGTQIYLDVVIDVKK
jgi:hypothetical protein